MGADWTGPEGEGPSYGEGTPPGRPYPTRPYPTRPYPTRPVAPPYPTRGDRPYPTRPYPTRPYPTRPYPTRGDEPEGAAPGGLDPAEWTADVSELFCSYSAVIRLGARVVCDPGRVALTAVEPLLGRANYVAQPATVDPAGEVDPEGARGEEKPESRVSERALRPSDFELALTVAIPNEVVRSLVHHPELAWAIKEDLAIGLAERADRAFLAGTGKDAHGPLGVDHTGGVNHPEGIAGDQLATARLLLDVVRGGELGLFRCPGWVFSPATLQALSVLQTSTGLAKDGPRALDTWRLLRFDQQDGGVFVGYPFIATHAAKDRIYFGSDWDEAWVAARHDLVTIDISTQASFQADETVLRAVMHHDFALRRPRFFASATVPD